MDLKILKILTVIAYVFITWTGAHLGGTFGLYIILGLFSIYTILISGLFLTILIAFIKSSYRPFKKYDLHMFLFGGLILFMPIIYHTIIVLTEFKSRGDNVFFLSLIPFLLLYGMTIYKIQKQKVKFNNEWKNRMENGNC